MTILDGIHFRIGDLRRKKSRLEIDTAVIQEGIKGNLSLKGKIREYPKKKHPLSKVISTPRLSNPGITPLEKFGPISKTCAL